MADLRPGKPSDAAGIRALGEAVVPATYDPIDAAYVQGSGVGTRLLDAIVDLNGDRTLWLERIDGNDKVAGFYEARGFVQAETVPNPPWPDDIWMRREP